MERTLHVSALSTEQVNVFRFDMFVFFSVLAQFAHVTCHDAGSDVTKKTHSPTEENRHEQLERRLNTGDNRPGAAAHTLFCVQVSMEDSKK